MDAIASQITRLTIVYPTVYSDADQRKQHSSASLAFVRWIHRFPAQMASNAENVSIWWRQHVEAWGALPLTREYNATSMSQESNINHDCFALRVGLATVIKMLSEWYIWLVLTGHYAAPVTMYYRISTTITMQFGRECYHSPDFIEFLKYH